MLQRLKKALGLIPPPVVPQQFRYDRSSFPACCQASIIHSLSYSGAGGVDVSPAAAEELRRRLVRDRAGYMHMAITASEQKAAEDIFEAAGFDPVHRWRAKTGSRLTLWVWKP